MRAVHAMRRLPATHTHYLHPFSYLDGAPICANRGDSPAVASPSPLKEDLGLADGGTATKASDPPREASHTSEVQAAALLIVCAAACRRAARWCPLSELPPDFLEGRVALRTGLSCQGGRRRYLQRVALLVGCLVCTGEIDEIKKGKEDRNKKSKLGCSAGQE